MRIQDSSSLKEMDKNTKRSSPVKRVLSSLFDVEIAQKTDAIATYQEDVDSLRKEIEAAGQQVIKEPTLSNFKRFRDLLGSLAKRISAEAYRLEKVGGTPQNPRYFEIITIINHEADKLYDLVIRENRDPMAITAKVVGIKGLVVDLIS